MVTIPILAAATALSVFAQSGPRFEVATIKPSKSGASIGRYGFDLLPGGRLRMEGATLKSLIAFAYGIMEDHVSGGPKWAGSAAYDIVATADAGDVSDTATIAAAPGTKVWDQARLRMQNLLAERFHLDIRKDIKPTNGYALLPASDGPKLQPTQDQGNASTMRSNGKITARRGTLEMLAAVLTNYLEQPVENRTGLSGVYDYQLEYSQDSAAPSEPSSAPSIFNALQQQLGLKLEKARIGVLSISIDKASRPEEN